MAVESKIVHCYQLSSESGLQAGYSATGHSYLLATKLAYKTLAAAVDELSYSSTHTMRSEC